MKGKWKWLCAFLVFYILIDYFRDDAVMAIKETEVTNIINMYDTSMRSQDDTIKYLRFKLTTLKSINHE